MKYFFFSIFFGALLLIAGCSTSAFFYYPDKKIVYYPDSSQVKFEEVTFESGNGWKLKGWFFKAEGNSPKGSVLLMHGNAGNLGYQFASLVPLIKNGYNAMVFDYSGYGESEGNPSQENVLADGFSALDYFSKRKEVSGKKIILFGQSLGGHLAAVVAARKPGIADALVIEGAFTAHEEIAVHVAKKSFFLPGFITRIFVRSKYDAINEIGKIEIPKIIMHSTEDKTIPVEMGRALYNRASGLKSYWETTGPHIQIARVHTKQFVEKFDSLALSIQKPVSGLTK